MSPVPGLWRASARDIARRPGQFSLSLIGIALGVAVVVAVDLAGGSARRAFTLSNETVLGRTTDEIAGGAGGFSERVYARLRRAGELPVAAPVVEGAVRIPSTPPRRMRLLGIDPLAEAPFRSYPGGSAGLARAGLGRLLARPGAIALSPGVARELGVGVGDGLTVVANGGPVPVTVAALLGPGDGPEGELFSDLVITDIATAQEMLGRLGRLTRIDLIVPAGVAGRRALARLRERLPAGLSIRPASRRAAVASEMTRAFNLNLTMMSLLALLVGMLLVLNAVTFSVIRRRMLLGTLRALGITRAEVFVLILGEAAIAGMIGTAVGLGLGAWLAQFLIVLVTQTINDLYFAVSVSEVHLAPASMAKGFVIGLGASVAAAVAPAWEATRISPSAAMSRSVIESAARGTVPRLLGAGLAVGAAAVVMLAWPGGGLGLGFASLFAIVAASVLAVPAALVGVCRAGDLLVSRGAGAVGALALRGIAANLSRTAIAVAALMVALATTVGVGVMVDSFRQSVAVWLQGTLRADIYVARAERTHGPALSRELVARLARTPGVDQFSSARGATVDSPGGPVHVVALEMARKSYAGFQFLRGEPAAGWAGFDDAGAVLVSEPLAYRSELDVGDSVSLRTDRGLRRFAVAGVVRDYSSDRGTVLMSRATYDRFWTDRDVGSVGIYLREGADPAAVANALRRVAGEGPPLLVRSNRALRDASMAVFDRTFEITRVLRWLTTVVAFVGVLSALMALELERAREVGLLRAIGLTRGQIWGLVELQTALMGLVAGILALPLGMALALVLIHVINRRSFGWSMVLSVDPAILLQAVGLAVLAAALAGLFPAAKMAGTAPATALREE